MHTGTQDTVAVNNDFSLLLSRKYKKEDNKKCIRQRQANCCME